MSDSGALAERFGANRSHPRAVAHETRRDEAVTPLAHAQDMALAGAKAAALARGIRAGLPVLPGFVLAPAAALELARSGAANQIVRAARDAWTDLTRDGSRSVVVRSSSTAEDGVDSSMAGRFTSVLDVRGWDAFIDAVREVVRSGDEGRTGNSSAAMAVLVQPFLAPEAGGVMFGADPVTGRRDRFVIAAVTGGPHQLVSGDVDGVTLTVTPRGKVVESTGTLPGIDTYLRELVRLQKRVRAVFGGPQDVEWAVVDGSVVLLQSRPITATGSHETVTGPILGPGPVAETFPDPLAPLEHDLWVTPMIEAIREVLTITGARSTKALSRSPVIVSLAGRLAADLELLGVERPQGRARSLWERIRPPLIRTADAGCLDRRSTDSGTARPRSRHHRHTR